MTTPNKGTPAGCFIGTLALLPGGVFAAGVFGLIKWCRLPFADRHFDNVFWTLLGTTGGGLVGIILLIYLAMRILRATDFRSYDPNDSQNLKW